jgi:pentatricopeptide repeat protein
MVSTAIDLLREATNERRLEMNVVGYNSVLAACANAGDWKQAMAILDHMEQEQQQQQVVVVSTDGTATINAIKSSSFHPPPPPPDMVTYGTVMSACERGEQWELVLACAKRATQHRHAMDGLALTSALHACQQLGLAQEALQYLQLMKVQQEEHSHGGDSQKKKTFGWQRQGVKQPLRGPDAVAYRLAISACARGGAWEEGIQLLEELRLMDGSGADVVAYTAAMNGCANAGEWQQALLLLGKMRQDGVQPNEVTMASLFGACATACAKLVAATSTTTSNTQQQQQQQQVVVSFRDETHHPIMLPPQKKALQLLQLMKKDETTTFVRPNIVVYNAAIRVCAEACDLPRALALWEDLQREGLNATIVTYGSLMTACERVGNLDGASKVFKGMKEDGMEPNEIIYGAAISCCRKAREPERAMLLLRKMIREGLSPNVATFHTVLVAQTEGSRTKDGHLNYNNNKGDMERAVLVYKLMKSLKYSSSATRPNRQTYHLLIRSLAARRYPREAEFMLHNMQRDGMIPDVDLYTATVTAYERSGQPLQALRLMESMREDGYDFYEVKVLNEAFKKAINLVHVVGKGLSNSNENDNNSGYRFGLDQEDGFEESFITGR